MQGKSRIACEMQDARRVDPILNLQLVAVSERCKTTHLNFGSESFSRKCCVNQPYSWRESREEEDEDRQLPLPKSRMGKKEESLSAITGIGLNPWPERTDCGNWLIWECASRRSARERERERAETPDRLNSQEERVEL